MDRQTHFVVHKQWTFRTARRDEFFVLIGRLANAGIVCIARRANAKRLPSNGVEEIGEGRFADAGVPHDAHANAHFMLLAIGPTD